MKEVLNSQEQVRVSAPSYDVNGNVILNGYLTFTSGQWIVGSVGLESPTLADPTLQDAVFTAGQSIVAQSIIPDDAQAVGNGDGTNRISANVTKVILGANTNDVDDFFVLPALASTQDGHEITIIAGAANCEMRTPAESTEEINSENCDGTKEYLITATTITKVIKISDTIGWMAHGYTAIGAVQTAVVPD